MKTAAPRDAVPIQTPVMLASMDDVDLSTITLCEGHPVRLRRLRGGRTVVEGWNGVAWVKGPDAADWASGRLATRKELRTLGLRADDQAR